MNTLTAFLGHVPRPVSYGILAAAVPAESVLLVGAFIPTPTLPPASGALARTGDLNLALGIVTAASAVVAGDAFGHRTGRLLGSRLRTGRLGRRIPAAARQRAQTLMARCGGQAVLLARFVPVIRTLIPHLAGATRLPYRRIAPYSLIAAPLWAGVESTAGYAAADLLRRLITYGAPVLAVAAFLIAAAAWIGITLRRRTRTREVSRAPLVVPPHTADVATPVTSHECPLRTSKTRP
ncbi:DedA family protein [Streptomyces hydrogenans]|uniref:DedA family protein n=1 Tax=Streptomyces hydrogenans TaxID=1873719 RepID=UPI00167DAB28|nr:DedA family protein [Streptomyces hydrogenans]